MRVARWGGSRGLRAGSNLFGTTKTEGGNSRGVGDTARMSGGNRKNFAAGRKFIGFSFLVLSGRPYNFKDITRRRFEPAFCRLRRKLFWLRGGRGRRGKNDEDE